MTRTARIFAGESPKLAYGIPFLILLLAAAVSPYVAVYPELGVGMTYDLTLTAPIAFLIFSRNTGISKTRAIPFFAVGVLAASFLLPANQQFHLSLVKTWLLPLVELCVFIVIGFTAAKTIKAYKAESNGNPDMISVFRATGRKLFGSPGFANALAFELGVFYYVFFGWRGFDSENEKYFSGYKKSGVIVLYSAIIFILSAETLVLHILVRELSSIAAWILTISSLYFIFQIFAHLKAIYQRPIQFARDRLFVRYGLFGETEIDVRNISSVELSSIIPADAEMVRQASLLRGLEPFNMVIRLSTPGEFLGFYGIKSRYKTLLLFVDENERLRDYLESYESD